MKKLAIALTSVFLLTGLAVLSDPIDETPGYSEPPTSEFHFARLIFRDSYYGWRWGRPNWTTDEPKAEHFLMQGITRLTNINGENVSIYNGEGRRSIDLREDTIFDYPWLYAVEVGGWTLDEAEATKLRDYLLRGGFLMVDDFHGSQEWHNFTLGLKQIFPDRPILDIPEDDEIFHVLYGLSHKIQIPGIHTYMNGQTWEQDGITPRWRGIYDDKGRVMVMINHNMDLGDAWEHADTPGYPEPMTALAYRFAINYVIYSMTH